MKKSEVKPGMIVAVNDRDDGQLYCVEALGNFIATLSYTQADGTKVSGGMIDISYLREPTKAQLTHSRRTK